MKRHRIRTKPYEVPFLVDTDILADLLFAVQIFT